MTDYGPAQLHPGVRKRQSSFDRTGGNCDHWKIQAGEERTIFNAAGAGVIRHIWFTFGSPDPLHLRNLVLRMYWDGETTPSVLCPVGDFFGLGHGLYTAYETPWLAGSAQGGKALNCWFPMPFANGARITLENQQPEDGSRGPATVYFYVDFEAGEKPPADVGRFHAHWRRECLTRPDGDACNQTGDGNYLIADIQGRGQLVGVILFIDTPNPFWYGEGDDMFFIDGEPWPPELHGTGTEDYVNTAWCPRQQAIGPHHGVILSSHPHGAQKASFLGKNTLYRFHVADPILFRQSLRATIEHGHANEKVGDWASTAFWYGLDRTTSLPALPAAKDRAPLPAVDPAAGRVLEVTHNTLSYFAQTGSAAAAQAGEKQMAALETLWRTNTLTKAAATSWVKATAAALQTARRDLCAADGRAAVIPPLGKGATAVAAGVRLPVDRIHGSRLAAPLQGAVWLAYDAKNLYVAGRFDRPSHARAADELDRIDLMLGLEAWPRDFFSLVASPTQEDLVITRFDPKRIPGEWYITKPVAGGAVPVTVQRDAGTWQFSYAVPWTRLGLRLGKQGPKKGMGLNLNVDRWHQMGAAWWASWAITSHHYYPPQMGGLATLG